MITNMLQAKTQLSKLVEAALRGEEVIIANRGKPMVRLVQAQAPTAPRKWGSLAGQWTEAEISAAFSPQADRQVADDLMANLGRRASVRATSGESGTKSGSKLRSKLRSKGGVKGSTKGSTKGKPERKPKSEPKSEPKRVGP